MKASPEKMFCLPAAEFIRGAQEIENRLTDLEEQRAVLQAQLAQALSRRARRVGWTLGCGPGVEPVVSGPGIGVAPVLSCNATWGFRIGGMK